jgi:hypothetical protein
MEIFSPSSITKNHIYNANIKSKAVEKISLKATLKNFSKKIPKNMKIEIKASRFNSPL